VNGEPKFVPEDAADELNGRPAYERDLPDDIMVYRISGAFFFGATARVNVVLDRVVNPPRVFILDFTEVPFIDITAAAALERFVHRLNKASTRVYFAGVRPELRRHFALPGLREGVVDYVPSVTQAVQTERARRVP
jgi:SulP family sulfate permease